MDIQSSIIINFILTFLMTVYLYVLWLSSRKYFKGIGLFLIGNSMTSIFTLLLWFQGLFPDFISIILANTFVIIGHVLIYLSFYQFINKKIEPLVKVLSLVMPLLILIEQIIFSIFFANVKVRIISMTLAAFYCYIVLLVLLIKSRKSYGPTVNFLTASILILLINGSARIIMTLYMPMFRAFINIPSFQSAFVIIRTIIMAFWPFGFAMLILEKSRVAAENNSKQKSVLLRELSHRTKNNMSIIISLINMQMAKLPDKSYFDRDYIYQLLGKIQNRVNSLSLVYKKLITTKQISKITIDEYFTELIHNLKNSLLQPDMNIHFQFEFNKVILSFETTGYLGLILNELITNSLKYAFPENVPGTITIGIKKIEGGSFLFSYTDSGTGMDLSKININDSIGLSMTKLLGEVQLHGEIEMKSENGFQFNLRFKDDLYIERV